MNYEIVYLKEMQIAGLKTRTRNSDPNMQKDIGELWRSFYSDGFYESIPNKSNNKSIGLYTNYESDVAGYYDVMACCEVDDNEALSCGVELGCIASGKYARFVIEGHMQKAVAEFWSNLWAMDLDRAYGCDFEEYQCCVSPNNCVIHMYISLKE